MLEQHKTKQGDKLLIAEMGPEHLENTIKLFLQQIKQRQALMDTGAGLTEYQSRLYGLEPIDVARAAEENRRTIKMLYPYLAEAFLRGMVDLIPLVQAAVGREGQLLPNVPQPDNLIEGNNITDLLNSPDPDDDDLPF